MDLLFTSNIEDKEVLRKTHDLSIAEGERTCCDSKNAEIIDTFDNEKSTQFDKQG